MIKLRNTTSTFYIIGKKNEYMVSTQPDGYTSNGQLRVVGRITPLKDVETKKDLVATFTQELLFHSHYYNMEGEAHWLVQYFEKTYYSDL